MPVLREFINLLSAAFAEWNTDGAPRLAAALAYYTAFSVAPLLVIVIAVVGFVVNQQTVRADILAQVSAQLGPDAAGLIADLIDNAMPPGQGIISAMLSVVALLLGALGVFSNLQAALNIMWKVTPQQQAGGVGAFLRSKLLAFAMLLMVGFLLLVSLVLTTALSVAQAYIAEWLPASQALAGALNTLVSTIVTALLFGLIFRVLPDVRLTWRDVLPGALLTAVMFTVGRALLASYLATGTTASAYGAAGAFVVVLIWIYYSAQILLFGAEFTQVYTRRHGSHASLQPAAPASAGSAVYPAPAAAPARPHELVFALLVIALAWVFSRGQADR
jgi:membrane protein